MLVNNDSQMHVDDSRCVPALDNIDTGGGGHFQQVKASNHSVMSIHFFKIIGLIPDS